jgi:hypothetical protein
VKSGDDLVTISAGGVRVEPSRELVDRLEAVVGESSVRLVGTKPGGAAPSPGF